MKLPSWSLDLFSLKFFKQFNSLVSFLQILFIWESVSDNELSTNVSIGNKNKDNFNANFINFFLIDF